MCDVFVGVCVDWLRVGLVDGVDVGGGVFSVIPLNTFDAAQGRIRLGAITQAQEKFNGSGLIGRVIFRALAPGNTSVDFDFTPESTTDTNVASGGSDVLIKAKGATYTIKAK